MSQQEIVAGSAVRRFILVLVVAAVMAAMMVAMASPAFASKTAEGCTDKPGTSTIALTPGAPIDRNGDQVACGYTNPQGDTKFKDNHIH